MAYIMMQHVHNNPIVNTAAYYLVKAVNDKKSKL